MRHAEFVHLHVHSEYSLLDGAAQLERLVAKAKDLRFPAIALTDHGNLFGAIDFYLAAQKAGVKPIIGCELYVAPGSRFEKANVDGSYEGANHCTVLARNLSGYKNLIKLVSKGFLEGFYYKPRVDKELLSQHSDGLLVLSGCLNSEVSRLLCQGEETRAKEVAGWFQEVFGKDYYFMELQSHGLPEQKKVTEGALRIASALGIPVVGTNDSHYLEPSHARAHEALLCIQTGTTIKDPNRWRFSADEFYLKSAEEMGRVFADLPEACRNTLAVAERCNLELSFGQFHLPTYQIPAGYTSESYLERLALEGCRRRYGATPPDAVSVRLAQELDVIKKMGFAGYFLVVWDFIKYAKDRGIAVGPGRGSAAGSVVAYSLGITNIDPVRYGLLFERFLNPERVTMPDMDIDFSDDRRDEVIEYVAQRYGRENVAQIITFGTLGAKAVIRDVGRALGMPYNEVDRIAKLVPNTLNITLDAALEQSPPLAEAVRGRHEVAELWETAKSLEGLTRHASTHAAGVVISDQPLIEHVPLYKGSRGEVTTQYAMGPIEKIGLLKMDFLGLRTLTVIANTLRLVSQSKGATLDPETIPLDDGNTYRLLSEANTSGVFQLESPGMREALRKLRPERLEDVIAIVALYRPGPMDLIPEFINRKHGRSKIAYDHPAMEKHLRETYGIMVYQEQVMQIAGEMAGFSMGEADILRRAMGKKDREMMATQRAKFIAGCKANRIDEKKAEKVFDLMEKFAGYGFNKCLTADTLVQMADGTQKPITEIESGDLVLTKDGPYRTLGVRPSGIRPVWRLTLANGMMIRCTADHPVFTPRGWVNAEDLSGGDFVAVARELPSGVQSAAPHWPALLGYALSEGSLGVEFLFHKCGLQHQSAVTKRVPSIVDCWDREAVSVLTAKLFQGDGCIHPATLSVYYATSSRGLARDVQRLLLKLGICSTLHEKSFAYRTGPRVGYTINVVGGRSAYARLQDLLGPHLVGEKQRALRKLVNSYKNSKVLFARGTVDVIPTALYIEPLRREIAKRYPTLKAGCRALDVAYRLVFRDGRKGGIRRDTLRHLAERLDSPELLALADAPVAWVRWKRFNEDGVEETFDIEVPGTNSFIANGVVVHNSHAAAYAVVAYHTAYLKANYPVEFMAALLTSETGDTDRIVRYIDECRAMGIQVLPPDVNLSMVQFTVVADTIRFGLAAIKNVGEAAIRSIVKTREEKGPFSTLSDFCRRADLRLLNRRVIESLIKAGAFDSLGARRAQLLEELDRAMENGHRYQRDRQEGQASFFDLMADSPASQGAEKAGTGAERPSPEIAEWDSDRLLAYEKEVLGLYLSGHPLARFRDVAGTLGVSPIGQLGAKNDGARVTIFGQVTALKEITTKSGDRMAFATVEDMDGSVEITIFPEPFKASVAALRSGQPILVRGRVDGADEAKKVLAEEIRPLEAVANGSPVAASLAGADFTRAAPADAGRFGEPSPAGAQTCRIRVPIGGDSRALLDAIKRHCGEHGGNVPLFLHLLLDKREVVVRARACPVRPAPALLEKVEALLGRGSIIIEYGRGA